jgi:carboxyl-terminal processing protease
MLAALARAVVPLASKALTAQGDAPSLALASRFNALTAAIEQGDGLDKSTLPILQQAVKVYEAIGQGGGIVLDLRSNPGGRVDVLKKLAAMMLPQGSLLVQQERQAGSDHIIIHEDTLLPNFLVQTDRPDDPEPSLGRMEIQEKPRMPLIVPSNMALTVLVDGYSASAAELLSGMLQANHRALIIGNSTLGKGVGQQLIDLPYGLSLHVTTFEFFPAGMKSDWRGVIVDQNVNPTDDGASDAQLDAAIAEVKLEVKKQSDRASAVAAALALHHQYFDNDLKGRADQDNKPVTTQDPTKKQ